MLNKNVSDVTGKMRQTAENLQFEINELNGSIREFTEQIVARDGRELSEEGVINVCTNFGVNSISYEVWRKYKLLYKTN